MIASNDWREQERLDALSRLESLVQRRTRPAEWQRRFLDEVVAVVEKWRQVEDRGGPEQIKAIVDLYRATRRLATPGIPTEYFFWLLVARLHIEAQIVPEALLHQKDYLGPLWERRKAIYQKHGWPAEDEDGNLWNPVEHLERVPKDYTAWAKEFDSVADDMEKAALRAVCEQYGVPEIAELKESAPAEYERRCQMGNNPFLQEGSSEHSSPGTT